MIIYSGTWSILSQWIRDILSGDNLTYTIESVLPVCDKHYHMNNGFQQMWAEIKQLWNHAQISTVYMGIYLQFFIVEMF